MSYEEIQDVHCGVSVVVRNEHSDVASVERIAVTPVMEVGGSMLFKKKNDGYIRFPSYLK